MTTVDSLSSNSLELIPLSLVTLIVVLVIERFMAVNSQYSPLMFFKALSLGISAKVNPVGRQSAPGQQKIAGTLAIFILVLPFVFLLYTMMAVAEFPIIFDGLILLMCLKWSGYKKSAIAMSKALEKDNKNLAKARLSPLVLRQTNKLSPLGLYKACIEMLVLRSCKEYFAVIFYYLTFGSLFVLFYRLMTVLNQCWNPKQQHYHHFGQSTHWLCFVLEWLPTKLVSLTIMLLNNFKLSFEIMARGNHWGNSNSLMLLAATAAGLKVDLGGPVIYNQGKWRRPVLASPNKTRPPEAKDIKQTTALVEKILLVWLLVAVLITLVGYTLVANG